MSGVNLDGRQIRKGAADAVKLYVEDQGGHFPPAVQGSVDEIARTGGTPLVVAECNGSSPHVLGVVQLKDIVKGGIRERFEELRRMGIKTVMITGDNPLTAAAIAAEAGVDDFLAQATPEAKLKLIRERQEGGHLVAMTGDGTNDAPALAQADVAVAMNTGTQAAKEAGNMVDLDSNPTKLIEIVEIGKQLLMTRGALTTFSIANDVAKYFAIIPGGVCSHVSRAQCAQPDAPGHPQQRHPVGRDLQRDHHHPVDSARPARRALPAACGFTAAAREPVGLWGGRADCAIYRHQADRHGPCRPGAGLRGGSYMSMQARTSTRQLIRPAIMALVLFTLLTGVLYPLLITGVAQVVFPGQANGSLITNGAGAVVGSRLIGQEFDQPQYFWGRLSATSPAPYNAAGLVRLEPRAAQSELGRRGWDRPGADCCLEGSRQGCRRRQRRSTAGRSGYRFSQRA